MKVSVQRLIGIFLPLFMMVYNLNWKVGAACNAVLVFLYFIYLFDGAFKITSKLCLLWGGYIAVFAVFLQLLRGYEMIFAYVIGYILVAMIFLKRIDSVAFRYMLSSLKIISIIQAVGVFLQVFLSNIYYSIMGILVEPVTKNAIMHRVEEGYYTGFSREVSLTIIFLIIGVALYISELATHIHDKGQQFPQKNYIIIAMLVLAILLTGKRGQPLFALIAFLVTYLIYGKKRMKVFKLLVILSALLIVATVTYRFWGNIPSLARFVELITNYFNGSDAELLTTGRTEIYEAAVNLWEKNKMFGIGWNNFKYSFNSNIWYSRFDVHNCYLQLLCENGFVGAIPCYCLIIATVFRCFKCAYFSSQIMQNSATICFCTFYIIFFLLYCITGTNLYEYSYYIIFFIAITQIENELGKYRERKITLRRNL